MGPAFDALYQAYPEVIADLNRDFTSHEFILKLAQRRQPEYIEALHEYRHKSRLGTPIPFMIVHGLLAQYLDQLPHLVTKMGEKLSQDIFGEQQLCTLWRKT